MDETTELSLEDQIAQLQKELTSANSSKDYWYSQLISAQNEIQQIHQLLDNVPGSPAKQAKDEYHRDLSVMTRLAIYFAARN